MSLKNHKIKLVILPVRDITKSAASRVRLGDGVAGGLWNAKNLHQQVVFYNKILANYMVCMVKYDINTLFIDFDKMVSDKKYLYDKLQNILKEKNVNYNMFIQAYEKASII